MEKSNMKLLEIKAKGFTLLEVTIVILILAMLLTTALVDLSKKSLNSKIDKTEILLKTMAGELDAFFTDYGEVRPEGELTFREAVADAVTNINSQYGSASYDTDLIEINESTRSFTVPTKSAKDGFGSPILLYGSLDNRVYILASPGKNKTFEFLTDTDPAAIDDILVVIQLK